MKNNIIGVYKITNSVNKKYYIGCSLNIKRRFLCHKSHLKANKHTNEHLQNAWNKYGEEAFLFEILEECEEKEIFSKEHLWVTKLGTLNSEKGYNKLPTSENQRPSHLTQEIKDKIGKANKGHICNWKGKEMKQIQGEKHGKYGKPNKKLAEFNKKRLELGYEHGRKGKRPTDFCIQKSIEKNKNNTYRRIKIKCFSPENEEFIFDSIKLCAEYIGCTSTSLHEFFKGKLKHIKNWKGFEKIYNQQFN